MTYNVGIFFEYVREVQAYNEAHARAKALIIAEEIERESGIVLKEIVVIPKDTE